MDFRGLRPKEVAVPRENTGRVLCSIAGRGNGISLDLGLHGKIGRLELSRIGTRIGRRKRGREEREIKREGWREEEKHGGEALLLTRKRNNSHRRANRTSTQNARSFLAALSTAIFVPPCLRDSSPRWEFIEP